jgi:hypothetical protein
MMLTPNTRLRKSSLNVSICFSIGKRSNCAAQEPAKDEDACQLGKLNSEAERARRLLRRS